MLGSVAVLVLTAVVALVVFSRLVRDRAADGRQPEGWTFDPERYRLLERLLSQDDIEFLSRHAGISRTRVRKFAVERSHLALSYIGQLRRDFNYLYRSALVIVATSAEDRGGLPADLFRRKLGFEWTVFRLQIQLRLTPVWGGRGHVRRLADALDELNGLYRTTRTPLAGVANI